MDAYRDQRVALLRGSGRPLGTAPRTRDGSIGARPVLVISLAVFGLSFCLRPLMTELWHWYALSFMQFATFSGLRCCPPAGWSRPGSPTSGAG